jgi:GAF domain-containing protein
MIPAPRPENELARLAALLRLKLLDAPSEPTFDALTRCAVHAAQSPIALISLVDAERQYFFSRVGFNTCETPREPSFCAHVILEDKPMIVTDALRDERFFDSPLVTGPPHVRVYLGAPLFTPERLALGSFCVIDHKPRSWTPREASMVTELANVAAALIQSRSMRNELAELFQACASLCSPRAAA